MVIERWVRAGFLIRYFADPPHLLLKNSEFFPIGQNFDSPSVMVRGIVRDTRISNIDRIVMSWSLVASVFFRGRTKRLSRNDCFCFLLRLLPIRLRATQTEVFDRRDDIINIT